MRDKVAKRVHNPSIIQADLRRLSAEILRDLIMFYAAYHQRRQTPGRVYSIPRRQCRMWLPISWGYTVAQRRFGVFEPDTFVTLEEIVRPGFIVIEIGAAYGAFTIELSRLVGSTGRVYSFEMFPPVYAITERNVALNALTNVQLFNSAVGRFGNHRVRVDPLARNSYGALDQISHLDYSARTRGAQKQGGGEEVEIGTVSLSNFLATQTVSPDLIFMDIEGCELEVLYDLQTLLRAETGRPILYFELHRDFYGKAGVDWLRRLMDQSGYATRTVAAHLLCIPARAATALPVPPFSPAA